MSSTIICNFQMRKLRLAGGENRAGYGASVREWRKPGDNMNLWSPTSEPPDPELLVGHYLSHFTDHFPRRCVSANQPRKSCTGSSVYLLIS